MTSLFRHGYALLIGVGATHHQNWSLPATVKDARVMHAVLTDPHICAYQNDEEHIRLLQNKDATLRGVLDGLEWLQQQVAKDAEATAVVYFSGHGMLQNTTGRYYLILHDTQRYNIAGSALAAQCFTEVLHAIQAKSLLVCVDCCSAEAMTQTKTIEEDDLPSGFSKSSPPFNMLETFRQEAQEALKHGKGRAFFTSSQREQSSWIRPDNSMSVYTYHLRDALQGAGNLPGDTEVRISNLMSYLSKTVSESVKHWYNTIQEPFFTTQSTDFTVALLQGGKGLPATRWNTRVPQDVVSGAKEVRVSRTGNIDIGGNVVNSTISTNNR